MTANSNQEDESNKTGFYNYITSHKISLLAMQAKFDVLDVVDHEAGYCMAILRKPLQGS